MWCIDAQEERLSRGKHMHMYKNSLIRNDLPVKLKLNGPKEKDSTTVTPAPFVTIIMHFLLIS